MDGWISATTIGLLMTASFAGPALGGETLCRSPDTGAQRCVYVQAQNEDELTCVVGTDNANDSSSVGYEYCLAEGLA